MLPRMTRQADNPVPPATLLYRRVPPRLESGYVRDKNRDCLRLSSAVFFGEEMSVVLGDTLAEEERTPQEALAENPDFFLIAITAADAEEQEQEVKRTPLETEPAHGDVIGKKPKRVARALRDRVEWVVAPEGLCPDQSLAVSG